MRDVTDVTDVGKPEHLHILYGPPQWRKDGPYNFLHEVRAILKEEGYEPVNCLMMTWVQIVEEKVTNRACIVEMRELVYRFNLDLNE